MNIRHVKDEDAEQITEIYNYYVLETHSTFEIQPLKLADMRMRFEYIARSHPFLVAEREAEILGYAYATPFKLRDAYRHSAEVSVYVKRGAHGRGIGTGLYTELFAALYQNDAHALIAGIALPNEASIRLHEGFGFEKVAHFREVGRKFGRWIDIGYWELLRHD